MTATKRRIDILVTEKEFEILEQYCEDNGQTKTTVIRELIRTLKAHTANGRLADQKAKAVESLQGG
jgi:Replication regulatory protein RepB